MRSFTQLLIRTYGKSGIITFTIYFVLFYFFAMQIMPNSWFSSFAYVIGPYYVALRYVSFAIHFIICFMAFRFVMKFINKELYIVRRKTLAFLVAAVIIQFVSFFCSIYVLPILAEDELFKYQVENISSSLGLYWAEWIALICTGYILPFYVGALKLVKFNTDMIIAPIRKQK